MTTATAEVPHQTHTPPPANGQLQKSPLVTVRDLLTKAEAHLAQALPKGIPASYMIRVVLTTVQRTPKLLECDPITLLGAVFQAAQLGLVPDGVLGQAYLVPFRNNKKGRMEVQFIPGYRGLISLVRRSGELSTIDAGVVREKDLFTYHRGTDPRIEHVPSDDPNPGKLIKVYAVARLKDGGYQITVMNAREVEAIKQRSASVKAKMSSPWDTDPEWMWKKTAIKQLVKLLPVSTETQRAVALDDRAEGGLPQDLGLLASDAETPTEVDENGVIDGETVQMPQRQSEQPVLPEGLDRIVELQTFPKADKSGEWGVAKTERGVAVYTVDPKLTPELVQAHKDKALVKLVTAEKATQLNPTQAAFQIVAFAVIPTEPA